MSTIAERVAAALAAETGEAVTSADVTRSPFSGYWTGQAGGVTVFAERGLEARARHQGLGRVACHGSLRAR